MQKKFYPIYFSLVFIAGISAGYWLLSHHHRQDLPGFFQSSNDINKLDILKEYILNNYMDTVSEERLTVSGIQGMLESLDPHSQYIPKEDYHTIQDPLEGSFEGIGIQFQIIRDTLRVIRVIEGGPSERAGLEDDDRIVKVNDSLIAGKGLTTEDVFKLLKGPAGSKVRLHIFRRGTDSLSAYEIIRGKIPMYSIDAAFAEDSTGYVKLSNFSATTAEEFHDVLTELKSQGINKLIIDLRNNAGGYLSAAKALADELLPEGRMIVYTEGLHRKRTDYKASGGGLWEKGGLIVLINEGSASASEILAGAIQDNDRGIIMGTRSYGKALVQEQTILPDSSILRISIAKYYTPSGRCIQRPYSPGKGFEEYYMDIYERDTLPATTDSTAYSTLHGRKVYGHGGIMPDSVINDEYDSTLQAYYTLVRNDFIYPYALNFLDGKRKEFRNKWTPKSFINTYEVDEKMFQDFLAFVRKKGVTLPEESLKTSGNKIKNMLKAYMGRLLYGDEVFYPVYLEYDKVFQAALSHDGKVEDNNY